MHSEGDLKWKSSAGLVRLGLNQGYGAWRGSVWGHFCPQTTLLAILEPKNEFRPVTPEKCLNFPLFCLLKMLKTYGETACSKNTFGSKLRLLVIGDVRTCLGDALYLTPSHLAQNSQSYDR